MTAYCLLLLLSLVFEGSAQEKAVPNKLIVLISTPRSLSSIFYRMMEARNDCVVLSEPGVDAYTLVHTPQFAQDICDPTSPKTFKAAEKKILDAYNSYKIVFVKEMCYAAREYLLKNTIGKTIISAAYCIFLIRNPHQTLISFYTKFPEMFEQLSDWVGYDKLYEFYEEIKKQSHHKPFLLMADELAGNPRAAVEKFCLYTQIPFDEKQLRWDPLANSMPVDHVWNNTVSSYWFDRALQSTTFEPITTYALDSKGEPTFDEISNAKHRELYRNMYNCSLPYYNKFKEELHRQNKV